MGRGLLLWLIGIPIPIILLIWLFGGLHGLALTTRRITWSEVSMRETRWTAKTSPTRQLTRLSFRAKAAERPSELGAGVEHAIC